MEGNTQQAVAQAIRVERVRAGIKSEAALARQIGVSPSWLSKRLAGDIRMNLDDVEAIAGGLGVQPLALIQAAQVEAAAA